MTSDLRIMSSSLCDSCLCRVYLSAPAMSSRAGAQSRISEPPAMVPRLAAGSRVVVAGGDMRLFLRRRFGPLVGQHGPELERLVCGLVGFLVEELPQARVVGVFIVGDF